MKEKVVTKTCLMCRKKFQVAIDSDSGNVIRGGHKIQVEIYDYNTSTDKMPPHVSGWFQDHRKGRWLSKLFEACFNPLYGIDEVLRRDPRRREDWVCDSCHKPGALHYQLPFKPSVNRELTSPDSRTRANGLKTEGEPRFSVRRFLGLDERTTERIGKICAGLALLSWATVVTLEVFVRKLMPSPVTQLLVMPYLEVLLIALGLAMAIIALNW